MIITSAAYKEILKGSETLDDTGAQIFNRHLRGISDGVILGDKPLLKESLSAYIEEFSEALELTRENFLRLEALQNAENHVSHVKHVIHSL